MTTQWKTRLFVMVRETEATGANKDIFAGILSNNGSGESIANEAKSFDVIKFERTINPGVVFARGTSVPLKDAMISPMQDFLQNTLTENRKIWQIAAVAHNGYFAGQLMRSYQVLGGVPTLLTTFPPPWDSTPFTWDDMLAEILTTFGVQPIPEEGI